MKLSNTVSALMPSRRLLAVTALLSLAWTATGCGEKTAADPEISGKERLLTVNARPVTTADDFVVNREYQGQIEARRRSGLGFDRAGTVIRVRVDEGATVSKGQLLAELDTERFEARKRALDAAVDEATAAAGLAASTLQRLRQAEQRNAVSAQDVDTSQRRLETAEATLRRVEAERDEVAIDIDKSRLLAPFTGRITARHIDEGESIDSGRIVLEIVESARPRARVGVPLDALAQLDTNATLMLQVGDRQVPAKHFATVPEQSPQTRTVDVLLELDASLDQVRIGEMVRLTLPSAAVGAGFELPSSALTEASRGLWSCFVAVPSESSGTYLLERRSVEVIQVTTEGGEPIVVVRGGLQDGDRVVMTGLQRLVPGQKVRLADGAAS